MLPEIDAARNIIEADDAAVWSTSDLLTLLNNDEWLLLPRTTCTLRGHPLNFIKFGILRILPTPDLRTRPSAWYL